MNMKVLTGALLLLSALPSGASDRWHTSEVKYVYPQGNGDFIVMFMTDSSHCSSVENPKRHYIIVGQAGVTVEGQKQMIASIMTALVTNRQIQIAFDDATAACYISRLLLGV